jgi:hypothetical protein
MHIPLIRASSLALAAAAKPFDVRKISPFLQEYSLLRRVIAADQQYFPHCNDLFGQNSAI